jgi:hypothetical protein
MRSPITKRGPSFMTSLKAHIQLHSAATLHGSRGQDLDDYGWIGRIHEIFEDGKWQECKKSHWIIGLGTLRATLIRLI